MTQLLMIMIIALLSCYKCEIKAKDYSQFLSKKSTSQMKGICALLVIAHHLSASSTAENFLGGIWYFSVLSGYLLVGYFFLISGYGMACSAEYTSRRQNFQKLLKRMITIIVPYITVTTLYCIYFGLTKTDIGLSEVWVSIVEGQPIVRYSWYSITILIVYILFAFASLTGDKKKARISFAFLLLGYVVVCLWLNYSESWYNTIIAVYIGILLFDFKKDVYQFISKAPFVILSVYSVLLFITCLVQIKFGNWLHDFNDYAWWLLKESSLIFFLIILLIIGLYFEFHSPILRRISEASYEIYLTHGLVMMILSEIEGLKENNFVYSILVLMVTLVLATLEHKINKWIIRGKR